jgi:AcrR family transcriptional regulator
MVALPAAAVPRPAADVSLPSPTLRQRRRQRTQQEIAALALELFASEGYAATSVEAIAERALISPRTFYRYFPAKEDVVFHAFPGSEAELAQLFRDLADLPLFDALLQASLFLAERLEADPANLRRLALIAEEPQLFARDRRRERDQERLFAAAIAERLPPGSQRRHVSRTLAGAVLAAVDAALRRWVTEGGRQRLTRWVGEGLEVLRPAVEAAARERRRAARGRR